MKSRLLCAIGSVLALGLAVGCPLAAGFETPAAKCGGIVFTPRSEDGVYDIRARRVSCRRARRVARAVRPFSVVDGPYAYRKAGFRCHGRYDGRALPIVHWACRRGRARITFDRA